MLYEVVLILIVIYKIEFRVKTIHLKSDRLFEFMPDEKKNFHTFVRFLFHVHQKCNAIYQSEYFSPLKHGSLIRRCMKATMFHKPTAQVAYISISLQN